ncbi:MAG: hypothetical protein HY900_14065 [Deltaproteobacteria bacterium]|nr:hypothetical protein [Deltaproteobacteria bacterium]
MCEEDCRWVREYLDFAETNAAVPGKGTPADPEEENDSFPLDFLLLEEGVWTRYSPPL